MSPLLLKHKKWVTIQENSRYFLTSSINRVLLVSFWQFINQILLKETKLEIKNSVPFFYFSYFCLVLKINLWPSGLQRKKKYFLFFFLSITFSCIILFFSFNFTTKVRKLSFFFLFNLSNKKFNREMVKRTKNAHMSPYWSNFFFFLFSKVKIER